MCQAEHLKPSWDRQGACLGILRYLDIVQHQNLCMDHLFGPKSHCTARNISLGYVTNRVNEQQAQMCSSERFARYYRILIVTGIGNVKQNAHAKGARLHL